MNLNIYTRMLNNTLIKSHFDYTRSAWIVKENERWHLIHLHDNSAIKHCTLISATTITVVFLLFQYWGTSIRRLFPGMWGKKNK